MLFYGIDKLLIYQYFVVMPTILEFILSAFKNADVQQEYYFLHRSAIMHHIRSGFTVVTSLNICSFLKKSFGHHLKRIKPYFLIIMSDDEEKLI